MEAVIIIVIVFGLVHNIKSKALTKLADKIFN